MIEIDLTREKKALKRYGLELAIYFPLFLGIMVPWLFALDYPIWPWIISVVLILLALLRPAYIKTVKNGLTKLSLFLGRFSAPVVCGVIYYSLIIPVGAIRRLLGANPLNIGFDQKLGSYFKEADEVRGSKKHMKRMF